MVYQLAQVNIAVARAPLESEVMRGFVEALEAINALAEASPGFVWRFKTDAGDATSVRPFEDPRVLVNLSVWRDVSSLKDYVFRSMHGKFFVRRAEWFEKMETPHLAMWWIPEGTTPTVEEAKARLKALQERGETAFAFTFRNAFEAPTASSENAP